LPLAVPLRGSRHESAVAQLSSLGHIRVMPIKCPDCGETEDRAKQKRPVHFSLGFILLAFLGGMIGGLFYGLGQESKFRCGKCGGIFYSHTTVSRVFFVLCVLTYATVAACIAYGIWLAHTSRG